MTTLWIVLAGGAGAGLRHLVESRFPGRPGGLPWALLAINSSGSAALGALLGSDAGSDLTLVIGTGLLGGFTSLSAASLDAAQRSGSDRMGAVTSLVVMLTVSVTAALLGHAVTA